MRGIGRAFTPQQYEALIKLTAALCTTFPKLRCDYPRDERGELVTRTLPKDQLEGFQGVLAHYHIQDNKVDPGPAFQWERVIQGARQWMRSGRGLDPERPATRLMTGQR